MRKRRSVWTCGDPLRCGMPSATLFCATPLPRQSIKDGGGLGFLGAPRGEGVGLVVAREIKRSLDAGASPEDWLVLVRNWDEDAESVLGVLRSWGLPVSPLGRPSRLGSEPAVSALRMALKLENEGWEAADLVRLLRHGQLRPDWPSARSTDALARAAAAVRDSEIYRGDLQVLRALRPRTEDSGGDERSHDLVKRLIDEIRADRSPRFVARACRAAPAAGRSARDRSRRRPRAGAVWQRARRPGGRSRRRRRGPSGGLRHVCRGRRATRRRRPRGRVGNRAGYGLPGDARPGVGERGRGSSCWRTSRKGRFRPATRSSRPKTPRTRRGSAGPTPGRWRGSSA